MIPAGRGRPKTQRTTRSISVSQTRLLVVGHRAALSLKDVAGESSSLDRLTKTFEPTVGPETARLANVAEVSEPPLQQVFGRHTPDRLLIVEHQRQAKIGVLFVEVDGRHPLRPSVVRDFGPGQSRDHAVSLPSVEPTGRWFTDRPLLQLHQPRPVLAQIEGDSTEHFTAVAGRRLDQKRNAGRASRCGFRDRSEHGGCCRGPASCGSRVVPERRNTRPMSVYHYPASGPREQEYDGRRPGRTRLPKTGIGLPNN